MKKVTYFYTERLELIAKFANLQIEINKQYDIMASVVGERFTSPSSGKERVLNEEYYPLEKAIEYYIESHVIAFGKMPSWAGEVLGACSKFNKLLKEYESINQEIAGEHGAVRIGIRTC